MAIPVARVHLKVAHAALPALLPTPPKWKILPTPCVAAILPKPLANAKAKPSGADSDERWDAHKVKPVCPASSSASLSSSGPRSADGVRSSSAGHGSQSKNVTSPPPKPGRADSAERWDAHKKTAIVLASSSSSSGASSLVSNSKWSVSRTSLVSNVQKKRSPPHAEPLNDGESSSSGSNDMDTEEEEEEEILWKPRAPMYAGPGFVVAAPQPSMIPMPTSFLVPVA